MLTLNPNFITDSGKKISVILPLQEFQNIIEELEELKDIKLNDEAKISYEVSIPIDEAFEMIKASKYSNRQPNY